MAMAYKNAYVADGVVDDGKSSVNLALLTGESRPQSVGEGHRVFAGAVNLAGVLLVRITAVRCAPDAKSVAAIENTRRLRTKHREQWKDCNRMVNHFMPLVMPLAVAHGSWPQQGASQRGASEDIEEMPRRRAGSVFRGRSAVAVH